MSNATETTVKMSIAELTALVISLQARIEVLETPKPSKNGSPREMTVDDANRIMNGDLKDKKHQEAADLLGLSYGQVYSCRLQHTFKGVHKTLASEGYKNPWVK